MGNSTGNTYILEQAKMIKQRKNAGTRGDKMENAIQEKITIKLEEINHKTLAKKED